MAWFSRLFFAVFIVLGCHSLPAQVTVSTDRPTGLYEVGETARFRITVPAWANAPIQCKIAHDKMVKPLMEQTLTIAPGGTATVEYRLDEPGTIFCYATMWGQTVAAQAAFSPHLIQPIEEEPADFDAFWTKQRGFLAQVPIEPRLTPMFGTQFSNTFRINLGMIDNRRVYGFISVPTGKGPFPAVVQFPAFGSTPVIPAGFWADELGAIVMTISIHNTEADQWVPDAYVPDDPTDPNKMYYRYAVLSGLRAIEYLFSRPDFDGKNLCLSGESQGAALSLMVAGLEPRTSLVVGSLTALCEHAGWKYNKASSFPNYLNGAFVRSFGDAAMVDKTLKSVKYYDAVYFAKRYNGPSLTCIGYLDDVSPAATIFPALNATQGRKNVIHALRNEHIHPGSYWAWRSDAIRRFLLPTRRPPNPFLNPKLMPVVDAGDNAEARTGIPLSLEGVVLMDTLPDNRLPVKWEFISGPGTVDFSSPAARNTNATFSAPGTYVVRFTATDESLLEGSQTYITLHDFIEINVSGGNVPGTPCSLTANVSNISCLDKGTPVDSTDDRWRLSLTVSSTKGSRKGWTAVLDNGKTIEGRYGTPVVINNLPFDQFASISISDRDSSRCTTGITVRPPARCHVAPSQLPDLTFKDWKLSPAKVNSGTVVHFKAVLKNNGRLTAPANQTIGIYLSVNRTYEPNGDWRVGNLTTPALAGGSEVALSGAFPAPGAGTYFVLAVVDGANTLAEFDDNNNVAVTTLEVVVPASNGGVTYCQSAAAAPWEEWINAVGFGTDIYYSGKAQYNDFTKAVTFEVPKNEPVEVTLQAGFSYLTWDQHWTIWIDANHNGIFEEAEKVLSQLMTKPAIGISSSKLTGTFTLPANTMEGNTRMRVSMKREAAATACEVFDRGEVEDYTVNIFSSGIESVERSNKSTQTQGSGLAIFPNPASDLLRVHWTDQKEMPTRLRLYNQTGALMLQDDTVAATADHHTVTISVGHVVPGVYWLAADTATGVVMRKVVLMR
jgi:cephalosporin-C deacetylase